MENNKICAIPWVHLNIIPRGKVYPCCMTSEHEKFAGDLNTDTIEEIWNSEYMKNLRTEMINNNEPKMCKRCFDSERSSGTSNRTNHNKYFKSKLAEIPVITAPDGFVEKVDLKYWDFRFSNLCNYKCRTCGPEFSSSWIPDAMATGWDRGDNKKVLNVNSVDETTNIDFLTKYINTVEKIYFAGGEPLLMDEHWQILDMLDKAGRYDVILTYNTNLSILSYKGKNVLDYWKKWGRNVWLWPSIDEIDDRAELIRSGTNWKNVQENLVEVSTLDIHVRPGITVSAMNVHRIPEILDRLIEVGIIKEEHEEWKNFSFNIVEYGPKFHISVLPSSTRREIKDRLEQYIVTYKEKYQVDIRPSFLHLFWHLDKPWNHENAEKFKEFTMVMDKLRNEDTLLVIPELKDIL